MKILLALVVSTLNIVCFFIGANIGQKSVKGEDIKLPNLYKSAAEYQNRKEAKKQQDKVDTILQNIENYDGTGRGQKDVIL